MLIRHVELYEERPYTLSVSIFVLFCNNRNWIHFTRLICFRFMILMFKIQFHVTWQANTSAVWLMFLFQNIYFFIQHFWPICTRDLFKNADKRYGNCNEIFTCACIWSIQIRPFFIKQSINLIIVAFFFRCRNKANCRLSIDHLKHTMWWTDFQWFCIYIHVCRLFPCRFVGLYWNATKLVCVWSYQHFFFVERQRLKNWANLCSIW